jgi:hypothetical protein
MPHEQLSLFDQRLYGDQWNDITDSPVAKRRAKAQEQLELAAEVARAAAVEKAAKNLGIETGGPDPTPKTPTLRLAPYGVLGVMGESYEEGWRAPGPSAAARGQRAPLEDPKLFDDRPYVELRAVEEETT